MSHFAIPWAFCNIFPILLFSDKKSPLFTELGGEKATSKWSTRCVCYLHRVRHYGTLLRLLAKTVMLDIGRVLKDSLRATLRSAPNEGISANSLNQTWLEKEPHHARGFTQLRSVVFLCLRDWSLRLVFVRADWSFHSLWGSAADFSAAAELRRNFSILGERTGVAQCLEWDRLHDEIGLNWENGASHHEPAIELMIWSWCSATGRRLILHSFSLLPTRLSICY